MPPLALIRHTSRYLGECWNDDHVVLFRLCLVCQVHVVDRSMGPEAGLEQHGNLYRRPQIKAFLQDGSGVVRDYFAAAGHHVASDYAAT